MNNMIGDFSQGFGHLQESDENKRNLIVNYLPVSFAENHLAHMFCDVGDLSSVRIIVDKKTKRSKGYGFVKFVEAESAVEAIRRFNGHLIMGKRLKVAYARPGGPRAKANLFVGNIPKEWREQDLEHLFSNYGPIIETRVLVDTSAGESRRCGFVRLDTEMAAIRAIQEMDNYVPPGQYHGIHVKIAEKPNGARDLFKRAMEGDHRLVRLEQMYNPAPPPPVEVGYGDPSHHHHSSSTNYHHHHSSSSTNYHHHHQNYHPSSSSYGTMPSAGPPQHDPYFTSFDSYLDERRTISASVSAGAKLNLHIKNDLGKPKRMLERPENKRLKNIGRTSSLPLFGEDLENELRERFEKEQFGTQKNSEEPRSNDSELYEIPPEHYKPKQATASTLTTTAAIFQMNDPTITHDITKAITTEMPNLQKILNTPKPEVTTEPSKPVKKLLARKPHPTQVKKLLNKKKKLSRYKKTESERELEELGIDTSDLHVLPTITEESTGFKVSITSENSNSEFPQLDMKNIPTEEDIIKQIKEETPRRKKAAAAASEATPETFTVTTPEKEGSPEIQITLTAPPVAAGTFLAVTPPIQAAVSSSPPPPMYALTPSPITSSYYGQQPVNLSSMAHTVAPIPTNNMHPQQQPSYGQDPYNMHPPSPQKFYPMDRHSQDYGWQQQSGLPESPNFVLPPPKKYDYETKAGSHVCVFAYNLPPYFSESDLYYLFGQYGPVKYASVHRHKDGTSKGFGFVNFYTSESARRSIKSLNGKTIHGKKLQIRYKHS